MNDRHKIFTWDIIFLLIILLAVVFMFGDIIFNNKIIAGGELTLSNYPTHTCYEEELKNFKIGLWNPYIGLGYPSFAAMVNCMLHPVNLICFFLFPLTKAMTFSLIITIFFTCMFMYIYARSINMSYAASIFCAIAFGLGASNILFKDMGSFMKVKMFLPLAFYFIERILNKSNFKNMVFLTIVLTLIIIGGHPQGGFYCLLASGSYIILSVIIRNITFKNKLLLLRDFTIVLIIALGLSAIQLIPSFELKALSVRWASFDPITMTHGAMKLSWFKHFWHYSRGGPPYLGKLLLIFFPLGIFGVKKDKRILLYILLFLVFLILSLGSLPLYKVLVHVPGFNYFRYCYQNMHVVIFFLILISGKGFDLIINAISKININRFIRLSLKYSFAIIIPLLLFIDLKKNDELANNVPPYAQPRYEKLKYSQYLSINEGSLLKFLRELQQENRLMRVVTDFNYKPDGDAHLPENLLAQFKIPSFCINGGFYVALNLVSIQHIASEVFLGKHYEILDSLGMNYLVTYSNQPPSDNWELVFSDVDYKFNLITEAWFDRNSRIYVFKNKKAFPRIFMVSDVDGSLIKPEQLEDSSLDYDIEVTKLQSDRITLETNQNKDAFLVMNDTYYPGWEAYVDGDKTKICLANRVCRAIFLPKGKHFIEFKYAPFSFKIGRCITLFTILIMIIFALRHTLKDKVKWFLTKT